MTTPFAPLTGVRVIDLSRALDPDDPDFATNISRLEHIDRLTEQLEHRFAGLDREGVLTRLAEAGIPADRIRGIDEVYEWPQTHSQRLTLHVEHETLGPITIPGMPLRTFEMAPTGVLSESTRLDHDAPPVLDVDGPAIRQWLQ